MPYTYFKLSSKQHKRIRRSPLTIRLCVIPIQTVNSEEYQDFVAFVCVLNVINNSTLPHIVVALEWFHIDSMVHYYNGH